MLSFTTFTPGAGGSALYKALTHPLCADAIRALYGRLAAADGEVALYDPLDAAETLAMLHPLDDLRIGGVYVQDIRTVGQTRLGRPARPVTELPRSGAAAVLIAAYDAARIRAQAAPLIPPGALVATLDDAVLPSWMCRNTHRFLDPINLPTNLAFFRDADGLSTRIVTANYWAGYGAQDVRLWLRLYGADGTPLATWEEALPQGPGGIVIDSRDVRARFGLPDFTGHLYLHVVGAAGHDTMKYVIETFATAGGGTLSCTHDANPWPADRYAGIPAPRVGERVLLWLENPHPVPIPPGTVGIRRMGCEVAPAWLREPVAPYGMAAMDVGAALPDVAWPAQVELLAGRRVVRPRYEIVQGRRRWIAHANVERGDLAPDPEIPGLANLLGRHFLLPFPVLDPARFRTLVLPTPMATGQADLPVAIDVFAPCGERVARRFLGRLPRDHTMALDLDEILPAGALHGTGGHAELVYDFREGGGADGWMHALFRYEDRGTGHAAESSFGSHIFNTILVWNDEPQSYNGAAPGLSTRLFLGLGRPGVPSFAALIHPVSAPPGVAAASDTRLMLHHGHGQVVTQARISIPACGSALVHPDQVFDAGAIARAGERGYVLVRDTTCRLFGYHGAMAEGGGFSLDHMFGF